MLYTPEEYGKIYYAKKPVSRDTVIRRIKNKQLHSDHIPHKIGRFWIIEVPTPYKIKQ
jgi:hypothetical protein